MAINKVEKDNITYPINDARIDYNALTDGTVNKAVGFDASGNLVKGTVSGGGTQLYKHEIIVPIDPEQSGTPINATLIAINTYENTPAVTTEGGLDEFDNMMKNSIFLKISLGGNDVYPIISIPYYHDWNMGQFKIGPIALYADGEIMSLNSEYISDSSFSDTVTAL